MGMYTQLSMNFTLKKDCSKQKISVLKGMIDNKNELDYWTDSRLNWCFKSSSYYFDNTTNSKMFHDHISDTYRVFIHCDFKNYKDEINTFIKWIEDCIECDSDKEFIGYSRYEESIKPTLYYITKNGIVGE